MKVFVAGATGAIGRPLVSALVAAGHEVIGMSSTESGARGLREKGLEAQVANALDENAVLNVLTKVRPHAVIEELTSLPKRYTPEEMRAAAERDRNLRLVGGRNVQNAARAAGAKRYVVQSTGFFYGPGQGLATEKDALAVNASPGIAGGVRTFMQIEERVLGDRNMQGVALRYGFFYGPGTYHDPKGGSVSVQVREQSYPVIGSGRGVFSFVHVEDATAATVAALECDPGTYNVVDDDPSEMAVWIPAFARFLGAPAPPHISEEQALQTGGPDAVYYAMRLRGASNACAKQKLGLVPRKLEWLSTSKAAAKIEPRGKQMG
jgi:nucleoside-diphosphate-sugar epimerase